MQRIPNEFRPRPASAPAHRSTADGRTGVAAVELALASPLLFLLVMGAVETANYIHLKQALTLAAYETAVSVTSMGGTEPDAQKNGEDILTAHKVTGGTIEIYPPVTAATKAGTTIFVTTAAPVAANAISPPWFFNGSKIDVKITMVKL